MGHRAERPTRTRATAPFVSSAAARVASIFAPLFGAFVLGEGFGAITIFALLGVPLASAGIFTFWLMSLKGAPKPVRAGHGH